MEKKIKVRLKPSFNSYLCLTSPGKSYTIHVGGEYSPNGFEVTQLEYDKVFKNVVDVVDDTAVSKVVVPVSSGIDTSVITSKKSGEKVTVNVNRKGE